VLANLHARAGSLEPARRFLEEALASARTEHERLLIAAQFDGISSRPRPSLEHRPDEDPPVGLLRRERRPLRDLRGLLHRVRLDQWKAPISS